MKKKNIFRDSDSITHFSPSSLFQISQPIKKINLCCDVAKKLVKQKLPRDISENKET